MKLQSSELVVSLTDVFEALIRIWQWETMASLDKTDKLAAV
jgi:hypothetical protein